MTTKLGTVRAHNCVLDRTEADEATEEFIKLDLIMCTTAAAICADSSINRLDARPAIIRAGRGHRRYIIVIRLIAVSVLATQDLLVKRELRRAMCCAASRLLVFLYLLQDIFNLLLLRWEDSLHQGHGGADSVGL